jgi:hypothetical protein
MRFCCDVFEAGTLYHPGTGDWLPLEPSSPQVRSRKIPSHLNRVMDNSVTESPSLRGAGVAVYAGLAQRFLRDTMARVLKASEVTASGCKSRRILGSDVLI